MQNSTMRIMKGLQGLISVQEMRLQFLLESNHSETELQSISQGLKRLRNLKNLDLQFLGFKNMENTGLDSLSRVLKTFKLLQTIHLDISWCYSLTQAGLSSLFNSLNNHSDLQTIDFDFSGCSGLSTTDFIGLGNLRSLKPIDIDFSESLCLTQTELYSFIGYLKGFPSLQKIHVRFPKADILLKGLQNLYSIETIDLKFRWDNSLTTTELNSFFHGLKNFLSLKTIKISFHASDDLLTTDLGGLKNLPSLQTIEICFSKCPKIARTGINNFFQSLEGLPSLKTISINFIDCVGLLTTDLSPLNTYLRDLPALKTIQLHFSECSRLKKTELKSFMKSLEHISSLQTLDIDFSHEDLLKADSFSQSLGFLTSLQDITLDFSGCSFDDAGLVILGAKFKFLTRLQTLTLQFDSSPLITDVGVYFILQSLKTIQSLEDVNLFFPHREITNIQDLWIPIPLTNLKLNFSSRNITDEILQSLAECIKKSNLLEEVRLYFDGCDEITSEGANSLIQAFEALYPHISLRVITLDFSNCDWIDYDELALSRGQFAHLQNLREIGIHFEGCGFLEDDLAKIKKDFDQLPQGVKVFTD